MWPPSACDLAFEAWFDSHYHSSPPRVRRDLLFDRGWYRNLWHTAWHQATVRGWQSLAEHTPPPHTALLLAWDQAHGARCADGLYVLESNTPPLLRALPHPPGLVLINGAPTHWQRRPPPPL